MTDEPKFTVDGNLEVTFGLPWVDPEKHVGRIGPRPDTSVPARFIPGAESVEGEGVPMSFEQVLDFTLQAFLANETAPLPVEEAMRVMDDAIETLAREHNLDSPADERACEEIQSILGEDT